MRAQILRAGELGSRLGAAAVLVADPANRRWLGRSDGEGEILLLASGEVRAIRLAEEKPVAVLADVGIHRGAMVGCDAPLARQLPGYACLDLSGDIKRARMRKEPSEVAAIKAAAELASVGQEAVRSAAVAGISESELWAVAQGAMGAKAGRSVDAAVDLMVGTRTSLADSPPGARRGTRSASSFPPRPGHR